MANRLILKVCNQNFLHTTFHSDIFRVDTTVLLVYWTSLTGSQTGQGRGSAGHIIKPDWLTASTTAVETGKI